MGELLLSIPDPLYYHPLLARMMELDDGDWAGTYHTAHGDLAQDVLSYNREQAISVGDFNVVTTTMHHAGLYLQDTVRFLAERDGDLEMQYLECHREFCAFLDGLGAGPDETYTMPYGEWQNGNCQGWQILANRQMLPGGLWWSLAAGSAVNHVFER
ncbi:hypothetical protein V8D89_004552 [Ganoderma adspersum]